MPLRVRIQENPNARESLEWVTEKLSRWAVKASQTCGAEHVSIVQTDADEARKLLENCSNLRFEQIRPFCMDDETVTLYYTCEETGSQINILGLYGYSLVDYADTR